jgi:hypothetical protein
MKRQLTRADWLAIIEGLSRALPAGRQRRVTIIGGVAMILCYGAHRTTDDMDVIMDPDVAPDVYEAAVQVGEEFELETDWLNQKAVEANLIRHPHAEADRVVFSTRTLLLRVPPPEHMLAMKLVAYRRPKDVRDARLLADILRRRGVVDVEDVWTTVGGFVPVAKQATARYNLLDLWDRYFP